MFPMEGKFSIQWFTLTTSVIILAFFHSVCSNVINLPGSLWWLLPFYFLLLCSCIKLQYSGYLYEVGVHSVFLGGVFSVGIFIISYSENEWRFFGIYMCVMSFFHYSEFITIALCNPKTLSINSFILNHSTQYNLAAVAGWTEFFLEIYLIPDIKKFPKISYLGLVLCVMGEVLRKSAMITGRTNFAHVIQTKKEDNHELVTHGVYAICRHPSYVGWFYWSVGTQILLLNPICVIGYTIVSWRFFRERIFFEEHALLSFFGRDYMEYQKSVGTGLPWIKGFLLEEAGEK